MCHLNIPLYTVAIGPLDVFQVLELDNVFFFLHTEIEIQTKLHIGNEIRSKLSKTLSNLRLVSPSNPPPPLNPTKTSGYASDLFPLLLSLPTMGRYCLPSCLLKVKMIVHAEEFLSL